MQHGDGDVLWCQLSPALWDFLSALMFSLEEQQTSAAGVGFSPQSFSCALLYQLWS